MIFYMDIIFYYNYNFSCALNLKIDYDKMKLVYFLIKIQILEWLVNQWYKIIIQTWIRTEVKKDKN